MHRIAPIGAGLALALLLTGCAQAGAGETAAPSAPEPTASETVAGAAPTTEPASSQTEAGDTWQTQDGAMRLTLPAGWSVDDRSAMGEASEMYSQEPGWLNEIVLLDEQGDQMLWYREVYGDDAVTCGDAEWPLEVPIDPWVDALADETTTVLITGESGLATDCVSDAEPGAGAARMNLRAEFSNGDCTGVDESIWIGNRVAQVDAVADTPGDEAPDPVIRFADEQTAQAWLDGEEAATLVEVLSSIEFTGAPLLDAAP